MTEQFVLVQSDQLDLLIKEVSELRAEVRKITRPSEWMSIKEAAEAKGVTTATIRNRINSGHIEVRCIGKLRQVRFET